MIIQDFSSGPFATNAYVVACPQTRSAALVDTPPDCFEDVAAFLEDAHLTLDKILLTHSHWDHIAETARFKETYDIPIYIHSLDQANLEHPGTDGLPCWISIPGVIPDVLVKEGDEIPVGNLKFRVIDTPGHTPGGVCFYCPTNKVLFSGDTLFQGTIGNLSFPTARPKLMWSSLAKLAKLPPETRVFPGHGPSTTIGSENWLANAEKIFGNS